MKTLTLKQVESPLQRLEPAAKLQEIQKEAEYLRSEYSELRKYLSLLEQKNYELLKFDLQYRNIIKSYSSELNPKGVFETLPDSSEKYEVSIPESFKELNSQISKMHLKVEEILKNKQKVIVFDYNKKLENLNTNLEKEKKEKFEHLEGLAEREQMLSKEIQMLRGSVGVIEAKNSHLEVVNKQMKQILSTRNVEIEGLEKKIQEFKEKSLKLPGIKSVRNLSLSEKGSDEVKTKSLGIETEKTDENDQQRYQKIIFSLQKMLNHKKNDVRAARNAYFKELSNRSEIDQLLESCIQELSKEIKQATKKSYKLSYNVANIEILSKKESFLRILQEYLKNKNNESKS